MMTPVILKDFNLIKEMNQETLYEYRLAKLNTCSGDLTKRWYVHFWAWSVDRGRLIRKRLYDVNKFNTIEERKKFAKKQIKEINKLLTNGFHFDEIKKKNTVRQ